MNRFQYLDQLFNKALSQPPSERTAFLQAQLSEDDELFQELMEMLSTVDNETMADRHFQGIVAAGAQLTETPIRSSGSGSHPSQTPPSPIANARALRHHLVDLARRLSVESPQADATGLLQEAKTILLLDRLLDDLSVIPSVVDVLELCYFAELSPDSAALIVGVSTEEAQRWCRVSRAFLIQRLGDLSLHPDRRRDARPPEAGA